MVPLERNGARAQLPMLTASERLLAPTSDVLMEIPSDDDRAEIVFRIAVPDYSIRESYRNRRLFHALHIPGYVNAGRPGEPLLPVKGYYLAVPEGASVRISVLESEIETLSGVSVAPAPHPALKGDEPYIGQEFCLNESFYSSDRFYPESPIEIGSYGYLRDVRVVQLRIRPVQFNPRRGEIHIYRKMRVKVELIGGSFPGWGEYNRDHTAEDTPFEAIYRNVILNYCPGVTISSSPGKFGMGGEGDLEYLENDPCKISIDQDGIYEITCQDLIDAGADPNSIDPTTIKMFTGGIELAIFVAGEQDGRFDPEDAIRFFGQGNTSIFSRINTYWLSWDSRPGLRMESVSCSPGDSFPVPGAFTDTLHFEENKDYRAALPDGEEKDHWFWERLVAPGTSEYPLNIPDIAPGTHDAEITVCMHGFTDVSHLVNISFNRYLGAVCTWNGIVEYVTSFPVPSRYISHEDNQLVVDCPSQNPFDQTLFNWVDVVYRRSHMARDGELRFNDSGAGANQFEVTGFPDNDIALYRITNPRHVARMVDHVARDESGVWTLAFEDTLDDGEYLAVASIGLKKPVSIVKDKPSNLRSNANQADYIVITHPLFIDSVQELVTYRRSEGLNVCLATIDDVYDEFNFGNFDPGAIKDFVSHAYHSWQQPAPVYLLLVGDASCDYRGFVSSGNNNYVPTHLFIAQTDEHVTSSDDWFGCVAGDDLFPDMLVGRITARSESDVAGYIDKVIAYETETDNEPWRKTAVLVADDPDDAGDFPYICDYIAKSCFAPAGFDTVKIYYTRYASACRQMIIDAVDEGCSFLTYVGHGSNNRWSYERMFVTQNIASMNNATRYPLVVTNTCKNGWFDYPMATIPYSMAEEFSRAPLRGAIACWSYSGLSFAPHALMLAEYLYNSLLVDENYILGSAACQAKMQYLAIPGVYWDQAAMLILLGDPALEMGFDPRPDLLVGEIDFSPRFPGAGNPDTLSVTIFNAGRVDAEGALVRFTRGHPDSLGSTILGETSLTALPAGEHAMASAVWDSVPDIGSYPVYVRIDPANLITESCEWNNTDFNTLTVRPPCTPGDTIPPTVLLYVDGKQVGTGFSNYDFTSQNPVIEAEIRDLESGVDIGELQVTVNDVEVDYEIEHSGLGSPLVTLRYYPASPLADDTYTFHVRVADCGCTLNTGENSVTFIVESKLSLRDVMNYPNPCREGARFRYSLSQPAREVTLRIYAVTGALVQTIWCSPGGMNENEFDWDGNGRQGNPLSSGVYFYRLTAEGERGRDEAKGKIVIVR